MGEFDGWVIFYGWGAVCWFYVGFKIATTRDDLNKAAILRSMGALACMGAAAFLLKLAQDHFTGAQP